MDKPEPKRAAVRVTEVTLEIDDSVDTEAANQAAIQYVATNKCDVTFKHQVNVLRIRYRALVEAIEIT